MTQGFPVLAFALLKIAVPMVLMPSLSTPSEITLLAKLSNFTHLFVSSKLFSLGLAAAKEMGLAEDRVIILHGHVSGRRSLEDLANHVVSYNIPRVAPQPVHDNSLAYMVFSSGTTGLPKGALHPF